MRVSGGLDTAQGVVVVVVVVVVVACRDGVVENKEGGSGGWEREGRAIDRRVDPSRGTEQTPPLGVIMGLEHAPRDFVLSLLFVVVGS